jgi:hypothetical protein
MPSRTPIRQRRFQERKYRELLPPPFLDWTDQPSQLTHSPGVRIGARRSPDIFEDSDSPTAFQEREIRKYRD